MIGRFRLTSTESLGTRLLLRPISAHGWYIFTPRLLDHFATAIDNESWNWARAAREAVNLGTGDWAGVWSGLFRDNSAWVLVRRAQESDAPGGGCAPLAVPDAALWDAGYMRCLPEGEPLQGSLWLPFGRHGLNRIQHAFQTPLPTRGAVDAFVWAPTRDNLRERGVTVVLQTPSGEATIAFGMWLGATSPSYKITGIRRGQRGYDDLLYHALPEIRVADPRAAAKGEDIWHDFVIDMGKTTPGKLIFRYRTHRTPESGSQVVREPLDLIEGEDYTAIRAIAIGSLPFARYVGSKVKGDHEVFVEDVWFTVPVE